MLIKSEKFERKNKHKLKWRNPNSNNINKLTRNMY